MSKLYNSLAPILLSIIGIIWLALFNGSLIGWLGLVGFGISSFVVMYLDDRNKDKEQDREKIANLEQRIKELEKKE